jgi:hypothetical protein
MTGSRMRRPWQWALGIIFLGGGLLPAAPAAAAQPSPEQLLAATVHAGDLAEINPGGWWDDAPEFNGGLEPDSGADLLTAVMSHVFGKPDTAPAEIATNLRLYDKAAAGADEFAASLDADKRDFGELVEGPKVGDESRYLHQAADSEHEGGAALRFRFGRYLARIDVAGDASAIAADRLAALGKIVIERLTQLDAGKLAAPDLPELAKSLPPADDAFKPVLGTATLSSQAWGWVWSSQASALVVSGRLRALLRESVHGEQPVVRRYGLAANSSEVAEVTLMPFRSGDAAIRYLAEAKREDARRAAIANSDGDVTVSPPIPDVAPAYRADLRVGRYVAEVTCFAPFAPTATVCETAVKDLAERAKKMLPAK